MKRLHVHVGVADLGRSIRFYSTLFAAEPSVVKADYAKWMLEDPRVNFAISAGTHPTSGIQHLGIEAESTNELAQVQDCFKAAGGPVVDEGRTICCYAKSQKSWIADPEGIFWETFFTDGGATTYGEISAAANPSVGRDDRKCCLPRLPA